MPKKAEGTHAGIIVLTICNGKILIYWEAALFDKLVFFGMD
jgi:hypothetical protein